MGKRISGRKVFVFTLAALVTALIFWGLAWPGLRRMRAIREELSGYTAERVVEMSAAYGNIQTALLDYVLDTAHDPAALMTRLDTLAASAGAYPYSYGSESRHIKTITDNLSTLRGLVQDMAGGGYDAEAAAYMGSSVELISGNIYAALDGLEAAAQSWANELNGEYDRLFTTAGWLMAGAVWLILIEFWALCSYDNAKLARRVGRMAEAAAHAAQGDFSVKPPEGGQGELRALENALENWRARAQKFNDEVKTWAERHETGAINAAAAVPDEKYFEGTYLDAARKLNHAFRVCDEDTLELANSLNRLTQGDFNGKTPALNGHSAPVYEAIENLRNQLKNVYDMTQSVSGALREGRLSYRASAFRLPGQWAQAAQDLTAAMAGLNNTLAETAAALDKMARGDFAFTLAGEYKNDLNGIKTAIHRTAAQINETARDMAQALAELSGGKRNVSISREYAGAFAPVKDGLNQVIRLINESKPENKPPSFTSAAAKPPASKLSVAGRPVPPVSAAAKPVAAVRPEFKPKPVAASAAPKNAGPGLPSRAAGGNDMTFMPAKPRLQRQILQAPSAAHVYDTPGYGKYSL